MFQLRQIGAVELYRQLARYAADGFFDVVGNRLLRYDIDVIIRHVGIGFDGQ